MPGDEKIEFAFERRRLTLLLGASGLVGACLFATGILVGVELNLRNTATRTPQLASAGTVNPQIPKLPAKVAEEPPKVAAPQTADAKAQPARAMDDTAMAPPLPSQAATAVPSPATVPAAGAGVSGPAEKPAGKPANNLRLVVQVGSFLDKVSAESLAEDLGGKGYSTSVVSRKDNQGRAWAIVRVGPYEQWRDASQVATELSHFRGSSPIVRAVVN